MYKPSYIFWFCLYLCTVQDDCEVHDAEIHFPALHHSDVTIPMCFIQLTSELLIRDWNQGVAKVQPLLYQQKKFEKKADRCLKNEPILK
jgi:hypothetical protein